MVGARGGSVVGTTSNDDKECKRKCRTFTGETKNGEKRSSDYNEKSMGGVNFSLTKKRGKGGWKKKTGEDRPNNLLHLRKE